MARFPLTLSAHPSAWIADADQGQRGGRDSAGTSCQFCGQLTAGWQEAYHLNDDHTDHRAANIAVSCPLCHLPQHLHRPEIDREAVLIWLPEMAQGAVNILARHIHLACDAAGTSPFLPFEARPTPAATKAAAAFQALYERAAAAELRLGTRSPRQLSIALLELSPTDYKRRTDLLGGVRLLPLGRLFRDGRDIYPDMLCAWAALRERPV